MASGEPLRAPIIRSSSPANKKASAKAPRSCLSAAATASTGDLPCFISSVTRWATTSVSVSLPNLAPLLVRRSRSSRKFSMMPLCATATRSVLCGWALFSVGLPWVAQRVWPMPILPASGSFARRFSSAASLPSARRRPERAVVQGGDAGGVVAAIFEALERLDQMAGDRLASDDSDDPAHPSGWPLCYCLALTGISKHRKSNHISPHD